MVPIYGLQKTTLLDYSGHLASTIFMGHCNFRCPYCHNASLILPDENVKGLLEEDVLLHLKKRKHILEGVCITGGEPTLFKGLPEFIEKIKSLGYLVKLDTNGTNPKMLSDLIRNGLIDYVAMDLKNSKEAYGTTVGLPSLSLSSIEDSVTLLLKGTVPYEFRTTLLREFHSRDTLLAIAKWIEGPSCYYLQNFRDSKEVLDHSLHSFTEDELLSFKQLLLPLLPNTKIRGEFS